LQVPNRSQLTFPLAKHFLHTLVAAHDKIFSTHRQRRNLNPIHKFARVGANLSTTFPTNTQTPL
jgi:hypothetical protein